MALPISLTATTTTRSRREFNFQWEPSAGIGGRLNPGTGGHYAAWIYPETSTGGSNILRLIKFQSYSSFSYLGVSGPIAEVSLPAVGTGFHTVKLAFLWNRIAVYFDGNLMITAPDQEATPYLNGSAI